MATFTPDPSLIQAAAGVAPTTTTQSSGSYQVDGNALIRNLDGSTTPVSASPWATRQPDGSYIVDANTQFATLNGGTVPVAQYGYAHPTAGSTTTTRPMTSADTSAATAASVKSILSEEGLDELVPMVDGWIRSGLSWNEIELQLRDPSTAAGKVFDRIYPEVRMTRENGLPPVSVADIQNMRLATRQLVHQLGFGDAIPDTNALARDYITSGKSALEMKDRLTQIGDYAEAVLNTNPAAKAKLDELQQYYGVAPTRSDLIAFALNDNFTEATLHQRLAAASLGAVAQQTGFGAIDRTQAETLGSLGVTEAQARQGFGQLAGLQGATGALTGQNVDQIGQQDQLNAAFAGNEFAQRRIARRQAEQQGLFQSGGGFSRTKEGFGGVGTAFS